MGNEPKALFHIIFVDEDNTEIKINIWGEQAIMARDEIQIRKSYWMTGLRPKKIKRERYQTHGSILLQSTPGFQYEEDETDKDILRQIWDFPQNISKFANKEEGNILDAIGFVHNLEEVKKVRTKSGTLSDLLKFDLIDDKAKISVSVWGKHAFTKIKEDQLIALKSVRVSSYAGKSLILLGHIDTDPQNSRVETLKKWKAEKNPTIKLILSQITNLSGGSMIQHDWSNCPTLTIKRIKTMAETFRRINKKPSIEAFKVTARIQDIDEKFSYEKNGSHHWRLKIEIQDKVGGWLEIVGFEKIAEKLFKGVTADQAINMQLKETDKFIKMMESVKYKDSQKEYEFHIYWKINRYNVKSMYLDFVAEDVIV